MLPRKVNGGSWDYALSTPNVAEMKMYSLIVVEINGER